MTKLKFNTIQEGISALQKGEIVILMDDEHRENEGDLCIAAEHASPEAINFFSKYGRGLICLSLTEQRITELNLPMMVTKNSSKFHTNFTVSIEAAAGVTTGISAFDRALTIQKAIDSKTKSDDLVTPGHVFPLKALNGGVLQRAGQTEGSVDLMRLAGLNPSAVICEILAEDGTMARYPALKELAKEHNLKIITIKDLIQYRLDRETLVYKVAQAELPTKYGKFDIFAFKNKLNSEEYIALKMGTWDEDEAILTRVHSQCLTGDVFGSLKCDCQDQLITSLALIAKEKKGVVLYLPQEGRGIGLLNKIKAYALQQTGKDTVEANEALGFGADLREYGFGAQALGLLGIKKLKLMTNNPKKLVALAGFNLEIVERIPLVIEPNQENMNYLRTKVAKLGHLLDN